jgi:hypothetical protein
MPPFSKSQGIITVRVFGKDMQRTLDQFAGSLREHSYQYPHGCRRPITIYQKVVNKDVHVLRRIFKLDIK